MVTSRAREWQNAWFIGENTDPWISGIFRNKTSCDVIRGFSCGFGTQMLPNFNHNTSAIGVILSWGKSRQTMGYIMGSRNMHIYIYIYIYIYMYVYIYIHNTYFVTGIGGGVLHIFWVCDPSILVVETSPWMESRSPKEMCDEDAINHISLHEELFGRAVNHSNGVLLIKT